MTPQERQMLSELFERLASLENTPRDPEALAAINDGLRRAPNALYPLVQTVLVQDEALKRADARIRELEDELGIAPAQPQGQGGFLDNMRNALLGQREPQGSVPSVRPDGCRAPSSVWGPSAAQPAGDAPAQGAWPAGRLVPRHRGGHCGRRDGRFDADEQHARAARRTRRHGPRSGHWP